MSASHIVNLVSVYWNSKVNGVAIFVNSNTVNFSFENAEKLKSDILKSKVWVEQNELGKNRKIK